MTASFDPSNRCVRCDGRMSGSGRSLCPDCTDLERDRRHVPLLAELHAGTLGLTDVRRDRDGRYGG